MRLLRLMTAAFTFALVAMGAATQLGPLASPTLAAGEPDQAPPRVERVLVIGQRLGNLHALLAGYTLRGTEGFIDGSAPEGEDNRTAYPWQVYYSPDGRLEAHYRRAGARVPHGLMEDLDYEDTGSWQIDQGELCQTIPRVASGSTVCFDLRRTSRTKIQMYYTRCGAMTRCYEGRLGPDGELFPGRVFTR